MHLYIIRCTVRTIMNMLYRKSFFVLKNLLKRARMFFTITRSITFMGEFIAYISSGCPQSSCFFICQSNRIIIYIKHIKRAINAVNDVLKKLTLSLNFSLGFFCLSNIIFNGNVAYYFSRIIFNRGDAGAFPIQIAIFLFVNNLPAPSITLD